MRTAIYLLAALLVFGVFLANLGGTPAGPGPGNHGRTGSVRPELEYLKAVNSAAPPRDPQLLFLLMAQYSNANSQGEGAEFFSARLKEFGPRLTDAQKALYLSAIGLLRAQHASSVSLLHRVGYVKETIAILEQAKQLSGGKIFVVNWIAGIVHAELPGVFHQRKTAEAELAWCVEIGDKAPHAGWLREVYYHLGKLALAEGEQSQARDYLRRSDYKDLQRPITRITPFCQVVAAGVFDKQFFGQGFSLDNVRSFKPDITIDRRTELKIGGTRIELIPVQGGETHDSMFIYVPDENVLFVGDFIMPYLGAPFVEEGDLQGLLDAIDIVVQKNPRYLLHGHEPLTRNFASASMLAKLKTDLVWLREQVLSATRRGDERGAIHQANLIPPGLLNNQPDVYQPYLILREHVIDRLYDQNVGYWQPDLQGMEHLTVADRAELLVDYLGLSERELVKTVERLTADGKYELAASLLESSGDRFERSGSVANAKRLVYLKLMEKHQNTDPFKFIIYSGKIGEQTPQLAATK